MKKNTLILALILTVFFNLQLQAQTAGASTDVFKQEGIASWYGREYDGRPTASGEIFNSSLLTAAHPTLPFGTRVVVVNQHNNKSVTVRINDRGPFVPARIIDVSRAAAEQLDMIITGTAPVKIESIERIAVSQAAPQAPVQQSVPVIQAVPVVTIPPRVESSPAPAASQIVPQVSQQAAPQIVAQTPPQAATQAAQQTAPLQQIILSPQVAPLAAPAAVSAPTLGSLPETSPVVMQPFITQIPEVVPVICALKPSIIIAPEKSYRLQVGSYRNAHNAAGAFDRLKSAGLNPAYERFISDENTEYFRVVLAGVRGIDIPLAAQKLGEAGFREALIKEEN